jgi:hypothetical protein
MTTALAWAGVALALLTLAVTQYQEWRRRRGRQRHSPPTAEIRKALEEARTLFKAITSYGGTSLGFYATHPDLGQRMLALHGKIRDRQLKRFLADAASCWNAGFAIAPRDPEHALFGDDAATNPDELAEEWQKDEERKMTQAGFAFQGIEAVDRALSRLKELEGRYAERRE